MGMAGFSSVEQLGKVCHQLPSPWGYTAHRVRSRIFYIKWKSQGVPPYIHTYMYAFHACMHEMHVVALYWLLTPCDVLWRPWRVGYACHGTVGICVEMETGLAGNQRELIVMLFGWMLAGEGEEVHAASWQSEDQRYWEGLHVQQAYLRHLQHRAEVWSGPVCVGLCARSCLSLMFRLSSGMCTRTYGRLNWPVPLRRMWTAGKPHS